MELNKDQIWYIILLPVLIIVLLILSAIGMSDTQFRQFEEIETQNPPEASPTTTP